MRPPRPEMSSTTPAPVKLPPNPPSTVRYAARLGLVGVVIGLVALVFSVVDRNGQLAHLRQTIGGVDSTLAQSDVDLVALSAFWGTLGLLAIVFLVQGLLIRPLQHGSGWARWVLLGLLAPDVVGLLLATAFLTDGSAGLQLVPLLLMAQLVLAVLAVLAALLPASSRWFRDERRARLHARR